MILGDIGHPLVYELDMAHVRDVYGPLLHHKVPTQVRPQQDAQIHAAQDCLRVAHLVTHLLAHVRARSRRLGQRLSQQHQSITHVLSQPLRL